MIRGHIVLWSKAIALIPKGWQLCDGTNGTPDLRNRFVVGAGSTYAVDDTGGNVNHQHTFTGDGHNHLILGGPNIAFGNDLSMVTSTDPTTGTTGNQDGRPPYYALAYIMKL